MAHYHVEKAKGRAKDQSCVDCGNQARDWSRIKGTNDDKDPSTFEARCRKCHMKYDDHKRNQRGKPIPEHVREALRAANIGHKYNLGRNRPDVTERNIGNSYAKKCVPGCTCGKHAREKCPSDCTCARHTLPKCGRNCTCGRHHRKSAAV